MDAAHATTTLAHPYVYARHDGWLWTAIAVLCVLIAIPFALALRASATADSAVALSSVPALTITRALTIGGSGTTVHALQSGELDSLSATGLVAFTPAFPSTPRVVVTLGAPASLTPTAATASATTYGVSASGFYYAISGMASIPPTLTLTWLALA